MSFIWRNAKEYNEDGSDMFNLATEFEVRGLHKSSHYAIILIIAIGALQICSS